MRAVTALSRDIVTRHAIAPARVLAHSDVAPARKIDPGEKFDWPGLAEAGIGHWVPPAPLDNCDPGLDEDGPAIAEVQALLAAYGYSVEITGTFDEATRSVVRAFQLHFRPARLDGRLDRSTTDTLARLVAALPVA